MTGTDNVGVVDYRSDISVDRSEALLQSAIGLLQLGHGLTYQHSALRVMRDTSQRLGVHMPGLAAALVSAPLSTWRRGWRNPMDVAAAEPVDPPRLPFSPRGNASQPNRSGVLRDVLEAAMDRAGTARGTVQLRDPVNDGLTIEDQDGFGPDFVDFFNYVDGTGSACADALRNRCQTLVDEVDTSPVFTDPARAVVGDSGVQSVLSTPLRDHQGAVRGIVSVHYPQRHARVGDAVLAGLQQLADDCGRWLHWHDAAVMPVAVAAVHAAAARVDDGHRAPRYKPHRPPPIVKAGQVLMDRYDLDPATAAEVLMRLANRRGVSIGVVVEQLIG